jgi:hypothetical protein
MMEKLAQAHEGGGARPLTKLQCTLQLSRQIHSATGYTQKWKKSWGRKSRARLPLNADIAGQILRPACTAWTPTSPSGKIRAKRERIFRCTSYGSSLNWFPSPPHQCWYLCLTTTIAFVVFSSSHKDWKHPERNLKQRMSEKNLKMNLNLPVMCVPHAPTAFPLQSTDRHLT